MTQARGFLADMSAGMDDAPRRPEMELAPVLPGLSELSARPPWALAHAASSTYSQSPQRKKKRRKKGRRQLT
jgi:hypothetical protein